MIENGNFWKYYWSDGNSFGQAYTNKFKNKTMTCSLCDSKNSKISKYQIQEPRYLILLNDDLNSSSKFTGHKSFSRKIKNPFTKNEYEAAAVICIPSRIHYSTILFDLYFELDKSTKWIYYHDGMSDKGKGSSQKENSKAPPNRESKVNFIYKTVTPLPPPPSSNFDSFFVS